MDDSKDLYVYILANGVHLTWIDPLVQDGNPRRKHSIILKDVNPDDFCLESGPRIPSGVENRLSAFAATMVGHSDNPKKIQKAFEKGLFQKNTRYTFLPSMKVQYDMVVEKVKEALNKDIEKNTDWAKRDLKRAVLKAHEHFTHEEVECIIREALVEYVMSQ
jgi:hypothetical protein